MRIALILALAAVGTAQAESLFGIELGAPFSVRECTADGAGHLRSNTLAAAVNSE
jgi:hypothetical protein